jgi:hypothetical protein
LVLVALGVAPAAPADLSALVRTGEDGLLIVTAAPAPQDLRNPWPAEWEAEFRRRGDFILRSQAAGNPPGGNTYFENEKRSYGFLMAHVLAGQSRRALDLLQAEDAQAQEWHRETLGIDYYACFTLKHQVRKYFYFGPLLDAAYRRRMFDGARRWTEQDPLRRPHYAFKKAPGWGPDATNSWVDVRTTENLFLMRTTSVYLMAEETGNEATRLQYKRTLLDYARALYRVGMGEWDSENYHGHSVGPLLNLYDFAKDAQVRRAAKAALDFVFATGAVKYYRGGFNGPSKRDYNHTQPFGGSAASMLWVYFGDCPLERHAWESDEVHALTSAYRPPAAVVNVARKRFERPVEILASKAHYEASVANQLGRPPEYLETQYVGQTFQLGSLLSGTSPGKGDVNGFKLMAFDSRRGVADFQCVPGPDPLFAGSPKYADGKVTGDNRVAQNRNAAVWLVRGGDSPWVWLLPQSVAVKVEGGVTFLRAEKTSLAVHPLGLVEPFTVDAALTRRVNEPQGPRDRSAPAPGYQVLSARGRGGAFCGLALEVGEGTDFDTFKTAVLERARADASGLERGAASYTTSDGRSVALRFANDPSQTGVLKDGRPHDTAAHARLLFGGAGSPVRQDWLSGTLSVEAGGSRFTCTVDDDANVSFENR